MSRGRRTASIASACSVAMLFAATGAQADALVVGLSDQHAGAFTDARFRALPIERVRLIVPWDAALIDPAPVDAWLAAAQVRGLEATVAFERSRGDQCPAAPCHVPTRLEFADAVRAFRARWPAVREFSAWNEPNHIGQPFTYRAKAAAQLHDELRALCPSCTVVAGDVVDSASMKSWLLDYQAALTTPVQAWGIHNYGDVTYERASYLTWLVNRTTEPIWVTETGGIVRLNGTRFSEAQAADAVRKAFALADAHPGRVERLYLYQWRASAFEAFDAGLLRPDGSERPGLDVLRARIGTVAPRSEPPAPEPEPDGAVEPEPTPAVSTPEAPVAGTTLAGGGTVTTVAGARPVAAAAIRRSQRGYRVLVRCPATRARGCRGRVTLSARPRHFDGARAVRLGSGVIRLGAGVRRQVEVRVPADRMRSARALTQWRLVAAVVLRDPVSLAETSWNRRT